MKKICGRAKEGCKLKGKRMNKEKGISTLSKKHVIFSL
jgi:hypothetical protein